MKPDSGDASMMTTDSGDASMMTVDSGDASMMMADSGDAAMMSADSGDAMMPVDSGLVCAPPTADCDGNPANGCEVNLSNDPSNCGMCTYSCGGGSCVNGACVLAMPGSITYHFGDFQCITTDSTNVYFMASAINGATGSGILYVPIGGGTVQILPNSAGSRGAGLVEYGNFIYWADYMAGTIMETPTAGQPGTTRTVVSGLTQPLRVAVDANHVYWTSSGGAGAANKATGVISWVSMQPGSRPWGLTIDTTNLYYADVMLGEIVQATLGNGTQTVFAMNQTGARGLVGDANNVYWTTSSGDVMMSAKATSNPTAIVTGQTNPQEMAIDTSVTPAEVYWVNVSPTGDVSKAPAMANATATVIAPNQASGQCVAVDSTSVYWAVYGGTQILKAPK
jgi:sugar lactone lactonase YvrE